MRPWLALLLVSIGVSYTCEAREGDTYESLLWVPGAHDITVQFIDKGDHWDLAVALAGNFDQPSIPYSSIQLKIYGNDGRLMPVKRAVPSLKALIQFNGTPSGWYLVEKRKHQIPSRIAVRTADTACTLKLLKTGPPPGY